MARQIGSSSRMALLWGLILCTLCSNASMSHGYASDARMICTTTEVAEPSLMSLLHEDPHVLNMTVYETNRENVPRANSCRKLNQRCSKGFLTCVCNWLKQAENERQDNLECPLFVCRNKHKQLLLKGDALYEVKAKTTLRISTGIGASRKEGPNLWRAKHVEDSISLQDGKSNVPFSCFLCRKFCPVARNDLVQPWRSGAVISDLQKNDYHDVETPSLEVAQVRKRGSDKTSEYLLTCKPWKGLSGDGNLSSWRRDRLNQAAAAKGTEPVDHVHRNIQLEDLSSLQPGRKSPTGRRRLFAGTTVTTPVEAPSPAIVTPVEAPFVSPPSPAIVAPVGSPYISPASAPAPAPETPWPPSPPSPPPPPPSPPSPPPPPPSPPPPPVVPVDFGPPGETSLLKPTINAPASYSIKNVSVFLTGVPVPFISITPSSVLLLKVASRKRGPAKLPTLYHGRQDPRIRRRLLPKMPTGRRLFQGFAPAPGPDWEPQTPGISEALQIFLQVDAGTLLVLLPGYLMYYTQHQPTTSDEWIPVMQSTDPWVWVPGAGIQFMATVNEMNDALLTLEFGLGMGNGKNKISNLIVIVSHQFDNLTTSPELQTRQEIKLKVAGAGAWFLVFQYTKTFYQHSLGVTCFFGLILVFLCCILGCCMCHDFKMDSVFQKNRTVMKAQNVLFNETRVFNPVWIPSAPVGPGRKRFIVVHNDKFLQQRLADHLSSLRDGAMAEKNASTMNFKRHFRGESYIHDVSDTDGMSLSLASGSSPDYSDEDDGSQSTHSTTKEIRKPGPLSTHTD